MTIRNLTQTISKMMTIRPNAAPPEADGRPALRKELTDNEIANVAGGRGAGTICAAGCWYLH